MGLKIPYKLHKKTYIIWSKDIACRILHFQLWAFKTCMTEGTIGQTLNYFITITHKVGSKFITVS